MKKFLQYAALLTSVTTLASCVVADKTTGETSGSSSKVVTEAAGNAATLKIKNGFFVYPEDKDTEENKYLALELKVTNTGKESLAVYAEDVALYDEEGEKISSESIYDSADQFELLGDEVSADKSITGYVVFEVEEDTKYELEFTPLSFSTDDEPIMTSINTADYKDNSEEAVKVAESYIKEVFLTPEPKDDKQLAETVQNDLAAEREVYTSEFKEALGYKFHDYKPTDEEFNALIKTYITNNSKRAKVTYSIHSYFPTSALIYVRPEVVDFSSIDKNGLIDQFVNDNRSKYKFDELFNEADKYYLQQLPTLLATAPTGVDDYMDPKGFTLKLLKTKDGSWKVDTSDYDYESIVSAFLGGA